MMKPLVLLLGLCAIVQAFHTLPIQHRRAVKPGQPVYAPRAQLHKALVDSGVFAPTSLPLGGNIWPIGGFYTTINVGTPPQPQQVQIDTGSSDLLVAQDGCDGCPSGLLYDPESSRTSVSAACKDRAFHCSSCAPGNVCWFNNTYETCDYSNPNAACSLLGPLYNDVFMTLSTGNGTATVGLGGILLHQGAYDNEWINMAGVWGLAFPAIASVWNNTVFDALVEAGQFDNVFAICIDVDALEETTTGVLTLGGVQRSMYMGNISYTPILSEQWYVLGITDMQVNGKSLGLPAPTYNRIANGTIVDSGTNTLVVAGEAYAVIQTYMTDMCVDTELVGVCNVTGAQSLFGGACFPMTSSQIALFPNVSVSLLNIDQELPVTGFDYLLPHPELDGNYCLGIQTSGVGGMTILGNVFMQPFTIVFDRANQRLGFAPVDECYV